MLPAPRTPIYPYLALLLALTGTIHLWIAPYHYQHAPAHGVFFAIAGLVQLALAFGLWRSPTPFMMGSGAVVAGSLVVLWGFSEWFPIAYDHPHRADGTAYFTKALEVGIFSVLFSQFSRHLSRFNRAHYGVALLVLPLLLGGLLYGAAVVQTEAGWFAPSHETVAAPEAHDNTATHEHTHPSENHESDSGVVVATVAVIEPSPTPVPAIVSHEIEPLATATPAPPSLDSAAQRTYQLAGESETITEDFELEAGLVLFQFNHPADTPFAFFLLDSESNHLTMPANHLHGVQGTGLYRVRQDGVYRLHAIAEDAWQISVTPLNSDLLATFTTPLGAMGGDNSTVSLPTSLEAGTYTWQWAHEGELAFEIILLDVTGRERVVALESTGKGTGSATFTVPTAGDYLVAIFADGAWSLIP